MPFFKTTRQREMEIRSPPALRDALDESGANRVGDRLMSLLDDVCYGNVLPYITWIAHHYGSGNKLQHSIRDYIQTNKDLLRAHFVTWAAVDSDRLRDFLDLFAQFLRTKAVELEQRQLSLMFIIAMINQSLEYEANVFRIESDDVQGFAVHRIGSQALQENAVQPALVLLREIDFSEALGHYETALRSWARGEAADAIREASHAFESTMKSLLEKLDHPLPSGTASQLITALVQKAAFLPPQYKDSWEAFGKVLQGVVTPRNKEAGVGHGSAPNATAPTLEIAEYAVNAAGTNIVFLIRLWQRRTAGNRAAGLRGVVGRLLDRGR